MHSVCIIELTRGIYAKVNYKIYLYLLQLRHNLAIIYMKNKNAAAYGCANTHKPAQVT